MLTKNFSYSKYGYLFIASILAMLFIQNTYAQETVGFQSYQATQTIQKNNIRVVEKNFQQLDTDLEFRYVPVRRFFSPDAPPTYARMDDRGFIDSNLTAEPATSKGFSPGISCYVDFSDEDALNLIPQQAASTFAVGPYWHQQCASETYVWIRPLANYNHFHLGYENPDVGTCIIDGQFGKLDDDSNCVSVNHAQEPRTLMPHIGDERINILFYDDTESYIPFDLKTIKIGRKPVRLCYKKVQVIDGPWIVSNTGEGSPGQWLCWNHLDPGNWDLSDWVWNVTEVIITAADNVSIFTVDDIDLQIPFGLTQEGN